MSASSLSKKRVRQAMIPASGATPSKRPPAARVPVATTAQSALLPLRNLSPCAVDPGVDDGDCRAAATISVMPGVACADRFEHVVERRLGAGRWRMVPAGREIEIVLGIVLDLGPVLLLEKVDLAVETPLGRRLAGFERR
jgi:hypothetical protein